MAGGKRRNDAGRSPPHQSERVIWTLARTCKTPLGLRRLTLNRMSWARVFSVPPVTFVWETWARALSPSALQAGFTGFWFCLRTGASGPQRAGQSCRPTYSGAQMDGEMTGSEHMT